MSTTTRPRWWSPATMVIGVTVTLMALLGLGFGDTDDGGVAIAGRWLVAGIALLVGLAILRRRPVAGSWVVIVGSVLFAFADPLAIPVAALVLIGGLWTGNLVTSHGRLADVDLAPRRESLTSRWFVWLATGAALGLVGFAVLAIWPLVTPDTCTDKTPCWQDSAAWATWILSWMAGMVTGGIGLVLGALRLIGRHRTRLA